jgi:hypothetical protein
MKPKTAAFIKKQLRQALIHLDRANEALATIQAASVEPKAKPIVSLDKSAHTT